MNKLLKKLNYNNKAEIQKRIKDEKFFSDFCAITGLTEKEAKDELKSLDCDRDNVIRFYTVTGHFPNRSDCKLLNNIGFENWYNLTNKAIING